MKKKLNLDDWIISEGRYDCIEYNDPTVESKLLILKFILAVSYMYTMLRAVFLATKEPIHGTNLIGVFSLLSIYYIFIMVDWSLTKKRKHIISKQTRLDHVDDYERSLKEEQLIKDKILKIKKYNNK